METVKSGSAAFNARVVAAQTREDFVNKERKRTFPGMAEAAKVKRLEEIWEQCKAAVAPVAAIASPAQDDASKPRARVPKRQEPPVADIPTA